MNWLEFAAIFVKLVAGGLFYTALKTLGQVQILTITGEYGYFKRSFFLCVILFASLSLSMFVYGGMKLCGYKDKVGLSWKALFRISAPGILDCAGQVSTMLGTMMLPISIVLVLKGSRVVFSALLSKVMLKRRLFAYHWWSVAICMIGLTVASLSSVLNQFNIRNHLAMGICLCLFGEFLRSVRMVIEERLMKAYGYNPVLLIGLEGIVGTLMSIPLLVIVDAVSYESWTDTCFMLAHSSLVVALLATIPLLINSLYLSGVFVTKMLSAVHNALITVLTVAVVWGLELLIYYVVDNEYGHGWGKYSALQLVGFVLVLLATLMYDSVLRIPKLFYYPLDRLEAAGVTNTDDEQDDFKDVSSSLNTLKV